MQFAFYKTAAIEETLVIEKEPEANRQIKTHSYSADYINLTRNFYLNF